MSAHEGAPPHVPAPERRADDKNPLTDPPARYPADTELTEALIEGPVVNLQRCYRFLGVRPGEYLELQALDVPQARGSYKPNFFAHAGTEEEFIILCGGMEKLGAPAVYVMLNQIDPAIVTRAPAGQWHPQRKGESTEDVNIQVRRVLYIDVDPDRPKGTSATDEQMNEAHAVGKAIEDRLRKILGEDVTLRGQSGNGCAVEVALDYIPSTPELTSTIQSVLKALGVLHGTATVKIDKSVSDAKRLAPAFGTLKRKGAPDVPERPHRRSACVCPDAVRRIGLEELTKLRDALVAAAAGAAKPKETTPRAAPSPSRPAGAGGIFERANNAPIRDVAAWLGLETDGNKLRCPGCGEIDGSDLLDDRGINGAKCHHDRCAEKGRSGFRTPVDLVAEARNISPLTAARLIEKQFGQTTASGEDPLARLGILTDLDAAAKALNDVTWLASVVDAGEGARARVTEALAVHVGKAAINRAFKNAQDVANKERREAAEAEFKGTWQEKLITHVTDEGQVVVLPVSANVTTILRFSDEWRGVIAYDEFIETVVKLRTPPWDEIDAPAATEETSPTELTNEAARQIQAREWTDADTARLVNWFARSWRLHVQKVVEPGLTVATESTVVHPVRDYIDALNWDGVERLPTMLPAYWRTKNTEYTREVGKRWMISAVARVYNPGCQADCVLIVEQRDQGGGKSSAFRALVPVAGWYADTGINPGDKDSYQNLRGVWIYGFDELDSIRRSDVTRTKNFVTQTSDRYRPSYARRAKGFPRRNVFCGTTNEETYLVDRTGNRRYWPVQVETGKTVDVESIVRERDQLWAEARERFRRGETWWMNTPELQKLAKGEQDDRVQDDSWETLIACWLVNPRQLQFGIPTEMQELCDHTHGVLPAHVLVHALGIRKSDITKSNEMRVTEALKSLGYVRGPKHMEGGVEVRRYEKPTDAIGGRGGASAPQAAPQAAPLAYTPPPFAPAHVPYAFDHLEGGGRGGRGVVDGGGRPETSIETPHPKDLDHLDHLNSVIEIGTEKNRFGGRQLFCDPVAHIAKTVVEVVEGVGSRAGADASAGDAREQQEHEIDSVLMQIVNEEEDGISLNELGVAMNIAGHHGWQSVSPSIDRLVEDGRIFVDPQKIVRRMP